MDRIVILGAGGFLGRHLVKKVQSGKGYDIVCAGRQFSEQYRKRWSEHVSFHVADFNDCDAYSQLCINADVIIDLVSEGNQRGIVRSPLGIRINRHYSFIDKLCERGFEGRYVFVSSGGTVYGTPQRLPIDESHRTIPKNDYGHEKLCIERCLRAVGVKGKFSVVVLRFSNVYGPEQPWVEGFGVVPALLRSHLSGVPFRMYGDGSMVRDYLYVDDAVQAIESSMGLDCRHNVINIGSGIGTSVSELLDVFESVVGQSLSIENIAIEETDVDANILDISKARDLLGWVPMMDIGAGLEQTVRAAVNQSVQIN